MSDFGIRRRVVIVARRSEHSPSKHQIKVHFGLTIAIAGGVVLGVFAGLTMLITVFYHRHHSGRRSNRIDRCRDRCPFDVKTASEWPLIGAKDVLSAGQVEDGCSDDMGLYGGRGAKSATAVFYDCSGQLRYSYSYQRCRPGEMERLYDPVESSSRSSSTAATTNQRRRTDEYELTELEKSMCYCSGSYKTHVGSVVPDSTTSGFVLDGGLSGRRVLIDVHPTAFVAAAANDSVDERSRLKAAAGCSLNRRSLAGDETRRQLVAELRTSSYSPTMNFADTIYSRRTTFNQRPSALRLTTFRPRTPSIGTTSTSGTADDVVNDAVAANNYTEHNVCSSAQTNFTSAASNVSVVDDVASQKPKQTSETKENLILEPAVSGSPETTSKNVQQQDQHRYHQHQQQQSQYIDSVGGEYHQGALQPDVLPVVVTVTNQQTLGSQSQTSRLVSQLGRQSVDQLL